MACAQQAPAQAQREWRDNGVALLPLGSRFEAARLPEQLVLAAMCTTNPQQITALLPRALNGPVIYDNRAMGGTYYALMRPRADRAWTHQAVAPRLGAGNYLVVPRLDRTHPPGTHWVVTPRFGGDLCEPETVEALISCGLGVRQEAQR
ncbi:hypothetical protein DMA15_17710 [Streptomyces sp. WAC 01529]|uniref:hypothetical protein n=1 Tax=Streptomyces sp. WAC 01529 TaxID=2203205 RepID=UPI000F71256B|nr:hypothetical protein [Streptomyces sp. WAC 01529]AZM54180.1 hypothetical protein DMA15_17710 [Streptomyces sp. WAC 01529]